MNSTFNSFFFEDDGYYPNHPFLPTLFYSKAIDVSKEDVTQTLAKNQWSNQWTGGVFDYHHYHSTSHEVLVVLKGAATLTLGGPQGRRIDIEKNDLLVIPAGVAHKNEGATEDFKVLGAYPFGNSFDLKTGQKHEYETALNEIPEAPYPEADPILGKKGPLLELWV
ncbi:cupin domain-containing protein [Halobacillus locisalis]|uniref:Cupin domain-containing protein n=1 Tax=Halobacillus locisalis TaxID=220753 RepID=A0A838CX10_9BACI|nr:cupin domain-containing protein [Halobacillus locisalis]MBA2176468.1 cupin domain-containing protein [Halobacillus locisalis]